MRLPIGTWPRKVHKRVSRSATGAVQASWRWKTRCTRGVSMLGKNLRMSIVTPGFSPRCAAALRTGEQALTPECRYAGFRISSSSVNRRSCTVSKSPQGALTSRFLADVTRLNTR